jgi:hypothetical protein
MGGHFPFESADSNPRVGRFLDHLLRFEDCLIDSGILEDDFVFYILGRKDEERT